MTSASTRIGHVLAKGLGIKLQKPEPYEDEVTRGESVFSTDTFVEQAPTTVEFLLDILPDGKDIGHYLWGLFPFLHWIGHYNAQWLVGDLVAGELRPCEDLLTLLLTRWRQASRSAP